MFKIGPYEIRSRVLLAPMAGITDLPFRKLCRTMGAGLTTSEMLTSDTSLWSSDKSRSRLQIENSSAIPSSVQIAGSDPDAMACAAIAAVAMGAQIIDINMGCPAKKVCRKLAGSALLQDEGLVAKILNKVVSSVAVPVTLKTRTGWNEALRNGKRIAGIAEDAGIQALAIHGRTRACRFNGDAEYDTIAEIASGVKIPVIANGDITDASKAKYVLDYTGATAVMLGRAAFGNPWIFQRVSKLIDDGKETNPPSAIEIQKTMEAHFKELYLFYGDYKGTRIARKHFAWYCQAHIKDSVTHVKTFNTLDSSQSQLNAVRSLFKRPNIYEDKVA